MAGKTNLTFTNFSAKKLLAKAHTSHAATDNEEIVGSAVQISAQTIFADTVPQSPSKTLNQVQNSSVEYVELDLNPIAASFFDANDFDTDAQSQAAGHHAYYFSLKSSYQSDTNNSKGGSGPFLNGQHLTGSLGALQIIPPAFSLDAPNPYTCTIYSGSRDVEDQISLTDEIDWYVDYYNGILYVQDYDASKIPTRAKAFIYVGNMLSTQIGSGGGGSAPSVGWIGSAAGAISTTGSLFIGTNDAVASNSDIYLGNTGEARFNVQKAASDFSVFSQNRSAVKVDASTDQVLILSGGSASSPDESSYSDVGLFVSGTIGAKNTNSRGVALFGGDVVISGSLYDSAGSLISAGGAPGGSNTQIQFNNAGSFGGSSAFTFTGTEVELNASSPKYTLKRSSNSEESSLTFEGSAGVPGASVGHGASGNDLVFKTFGNGGSSLEEMMRLGGYQSGDNRQVVFLSGSGLHAGAMQPQNASDIAFFVSGAVDSRGGPSKGTAAFGGDLAVSGTLAVNLSDEGVGSQFVVTTDGKVGIGTSTPAYKLSVGGNMEVGEFIYHKNDVNTFVRFQEDQLHIKAGGRSMINMKEGASDRVLVLSGAGSANSPDPAGFTDTNFFVSGTIGSKGTTNAGTSVFGGDVVVSGSIYKSDGSVIDGGVNLTGGSGLDNQMITADGAGNIVAESNITFNGSQLVVTGSILPGSDQLYNLGGPKNRFANIYTGDLHLRNDRGHWQIIEEANDLTVVNRLTGKKYKFALIPYEDDG